MLHIVTTRIAKSQSKVNCSGLRGIDVGCYPRSVIHKLRSRRTSLSVTSIGTEENSLRVLLQKLGHLYTKEATK